MQGKGKWAVLLLALGIMFAGCFEGTSGSSSEESAVAAKDNPVLGTWLVTVDPQNNKIDISPVLMQDACTGGMGPSHHPDCLRYSAITQITLTDMVTTSSETVTVTLAGTAWANLGHTNIIPGSQTVWKTGPPKTYYVEGKDYNFLNPDGAFKAVGQIQRTATSSIGDGSTVNVEYGFGASTAGCPAYGIQSGDTFADCFYLGNYIGATLEKVRLWTGLVSGTGGSALLGDGSTSTGKTDYPLLDQTIPANYEVARVGRTMLVDGWTAGICVTAWGQWSTYSPATPPNVEGCTLIGHPKSPAAIEYAPAWIDPVCGRSFIEPWRFTGTASRYWFYTQMTGHVIEWMPDYMKWPHGYPPHRGNDYKNYSTWYALMAYLVPDDVSLYGTWCNNNSTPGGAMGWWAGSMVPVKFGSTKHCGTLITDPHLARGTYFALNIGLEYSDTVETMGQKFWGEYNAVRNPATAVADGAFYIQEFDAELIYDNSKLQDFPSTGPGTIMRVRGAGTTMEPLGFVQNAVLTTGQDKSVNLDPGVGPHYKNNQSWNMGGAVAQFATGGQILVAQYISSLGFSFASTLASNSNVNAYVTQGAGTKCRLLPGYPIMAGQWGFVHYTGTSGNCVMTVEAPDNDLDFWAGMMILQVRKTIRPGDFAFLRYDQSESTGALWHYNSKTGQISDDVTSPCACKSNGYGCGGSCAPAPYPFDYIMGGGFELADPALPPGEKTGNAEVRAVGCPYGDGKYTCGGHHFIGGVVCVQ